MTHTDEYLDLSQASMADVALAFPQAVDILRKYNLDFCCGGKESFRVACEKANLGWEEIWREIAEAKVTPRSDNRMNFDTWDISLIMEFILQHHHAYVREAIPQIRQLLEKICPTHGQDIPYLFSIQSSFDELADELIPHMRKEEEILFPAIRGIIQLKNAHSDVSVAQAHLEIPIMIMEHDHDRAGVLIKSIRSMTNYYSPPPQACPTFKMAYFMLDQFDSDLMQHIHIENNILFRKALDNQSTITATT